MGALPNVYPGYQKVTDPAAKDKFEKAWGVELDDKLGMMMPAMFDGLIDGKVRGMYIFGENVANTEPDIRHVEHCLESAEFVVANDIFPTETTRFADVISPGRGLERGRRHLHQQRAPGQPGAQGGGPAGTGQAQLVGVQGAGQAHGPRLGVQLRPGDLGQRDLGLGPPNGGHQV